MLRLIDRHVHNVQHSQHDTAPLTAMALHAPHPIPCYQPIATPCYSLLLTNYASTRLLLFAATLLLPLTACSAPPTLLLTHSYSLLPVVTPCYLLLLTHCYFWLQVLTHCYSLLLPFHSELHIPCMLLASSNQLGKAGRPTR